MNMLTVFPAATMLFFANAARSTCIACDATSPAFVTATSTLEINTHGSSITDATVDAASLIGTSIFPLAS